MRRLVAAVGLGAVAMATWLHVAQPTHAATPPSLGLVPIAQVDGEMTAAATAGHYAYVAMRGRLAVVDLSDPDAPRVVGHSDAVASLSTAYQLAAHISTVVVADGVVYLTVAARLLLVDVSLPTRPSFIAAIDLPADGTQPAASFAKVQDRRLYLGIGRQLLVYDVSRRTRPTLLGSYRWPKLGVWRPDIADVNGGRAYLQVMSYGDIGFRVLDVADPSRIHELGVFTPTFRTNYAAMVGSTAFFARYESGPVGTWISQLVAFDLSNPAQVVELASMGLGNSYVRISAYGDDVFVQDNVDFVGSILHRWRRVDVRDPAHPREVAATEVPARGQMIGRIEDRFVYFAPSSFYASGGWNGNSFDALATVDLDAPDTARMRGELRPLTRPRALARLAGYLYVTAWDGLHVYDVSRPAFPERVAWLPGNYAAIAAAGDRLCVLEQAAVLPAQVVAFDVSDPAQPRRLGATPSEAGMALRILGHRLFVTGGERAVATFDIAAAGPPVPLGVLEIDLGQRGSEDWRFANLEVAGEHAYVLDGDTTDLYIIDVAEPAHPRQELRLAGLRGSAVRDGWWWAPRLAQLGGGYLLLPNRLSGLQIIDFAVQLAPIRTVHSSIHASFVTVDGNRAFAYGGAGLQVLDVAAPKAARVIGEAPFVADYLLADGDILYSIIPWTGLTVLRLGGSPVYLPMIGATAGSSSVAASTEDEMRVAASVTRGRVAGRMGWPLASAR